MIDWNKIDTSGSKPKANGEVQTLCPSCSHTRKKKTDKCLSVKSKRATNRNLILSLIIVLNQEHKRT